MEITFKYKDKIITTPNLEKKLKRMKIQLSDIEIIETLVKKEKKESGIEDYMKDKEQVIIKSTLDDIQRVCYVKKGTRPPIKDILKKQIWNPETKTGIYSELFIETMYYKDLFRLLYEANIKEIKAIRNLAIEYNMLNEQETLNWLDALNKYSLDPEQT